MLAPLHTFSKVSEDPYSKCYKSNHKYRIDPLGEFSLEAILVPDTTFNQEIVDLLHHTVKQAQQDIDEILRLIHQSYQYSLEGGLDTRPLNQEELLTQLRSHALYIQEPDEEGEAMEQRIYFTPEWEQEHGLYLQYHDGQWIFAEPA